MNIIEKAKQEINEILEILYVRKSVSTYKARLLSIMRVFFSTGNLDNFTDAMIDAVTFNLDQAWFAATKQCGFTRDEASDDELEALEGLIQISLDSIPGLVIDLEAGREDGKSSSDFEYRIDIWANRWDEAFNQARTMACSDMKLKWVIDPTKANCRTCLALDGKVKRASTWDDHGVYPQATNGTLACNGYNCGCELVQTNEPLSRGPLPNVP